MTLAIEPMVNVGGPDIRTLDDKWTVVTSDRSLSAHFERTAAVAENGAHACRGGGGRSESQFVASRFHRALTLSTNAPSSS